MENCAESRHSAAPLGPKSRLRKSRRERYELVEEIGAGAAGTVYRALDRDLDRVVAVKVLRPELISDTAQLLRFKREIVLASKVSDPHVVRVHDIGQIAGRILIAMDWVNGESLERLLRRVHRLPPSQVYSFARQICQALRVIHAANIIHRDLKPGNLLVREDGVILVSDFGLARSALPQDFSLTQAGETGYTPRYASPEQLAGLPADIRSDIYSFGLILLEMLTGTTALEDLTALRWNLTTSSVEKGRRRGELRNLAILDTIVRRCLQLDRTSRYSSIDETLTDLTAADTPTVDPASLPRSGRIRVLLQSRKLKIGLLAAIILMVTSQYLVSRRNAVATVGQSQQLYARAMSLLTADSGEPELREALGTLERALADQPTQADAVRAELQTLVRLYELTRDQQWLVKARVALNGHAAAHLRAQERILFQARIDFDVGRLGDVVRTLQADLGLLRTSAEANLTLGRAMEASGEVVQALGYYRAAIRLSPEDWDTHNVLGAAQLGLGRLKEATEEFTLVTKLRPDSPTGYSNLGAALLELGDLPGARRNFEKALERGPSPSAYYCLGVTSYYAREYAASVPFFEAAIRMRPNSDVYLLALGDVLRHLHRAERARDTYARALTMLEQPTRTGSLSVEEQSRRAIYLARIGDLSGATSALGSIAPDTANGKVFYARAIVALLDGHVATANRYLRDAVHSGYPSMLIEMNPDLDDVRSPPAGNR